MTARSETGQVGGVEALAFGTLLFVFGTLAVANAWGVIDAKMAAAAAAREGARAYVESTAADTADGDAERAGRDAMAAHGRDGSSLRITVVEGSFTRCERVVVEARYELRLVGIPAVGSTARTVSVAARHSEIVDPFRSGVAGDEARCAA